MNRRARLVQWYYRLTALLLAGMVTGTLLYLFIINRTSRDMLAFDQMPATSIFASVMMGVVTYVFRRHGGVRFMCLKHGLPLCFNIQHGWVD